MLAFVMCEMRQQKVCHAVGGNLAVTGFGKCETNLLQL